MFIIMLTLLLTVLLGIGLTALGVQLLLHFTMPTTQPTADKNIA